MTRLIGKALVFCVFGLTMSDAALSQCPPHLACIPSGANCTVPPTIVLMDLPNSRNHVGVNPGVCGSQVITIRDALNNPVANAVVTLDFSTCPSSIRLASTQSDPAVTVDCANKRLTKTTNALGEVCFSAEGASTVIDPSNLYAFYNGLTPRNLGPSAGTACCRVYVGGGILILTRPVIVNKYDLNGNGSVNAADLSYLLDSMGFYTSGNYRTFGDYNGDGAVNAADGSLHLGAQGNAGAGEVVYAGTYCGVAPKPEPSDAPTWSLVKSLYLQR